MCGKKSPQAKVGFSEDQTFPCVNDFYSMHLSQEMKKYEQAVEAADMRTFQTPPDKFQASPSSSTCKYAKPSSAKPGQQQQQFLSLLN